ncbi:hypothetical protein [Methylosinus trichosporium]|uniref:hypothetical protein n=1 Tax=Methylosinus trichosporium TaxID=426 RepID=UPI0012FFFAB8|nr:hypothetical protein [Methylosinus trichosporium]
MLVLEPRAGYRQFRELVTQIFVDMELIDEFLGVLQRIGEIGLEFRIAKPLVRIVEKRVGDAIDPSGELRIARFDLRLPFLEFGEQPGCRQMIASAGQLFADRLALAWVHGAVQLSPQLFDMLRVGRVGAPVIRSGRRIGLARGILGFGGHGMSASWNRENARISGGRRHVSISWKGSASEARQRA